LETLLKRVKAFISKNKLLETGETVVLAVSGGPDSLCLLHLFNRFAEEMQLKLVVAHLNHCLRPEGKAEAEGVGGLAKRLGLPCEIKAVDINKLKKELGIGEEEAGRKARYDLMLETAKKYGAKSIATGHHRDDQAETILLNILRGSSVDGLAGILPRRFWKGFFLIRPLLCLQRQEIESFCKKQGFEPYIDSSNLETNYKRNQVRLKLIPCLEKNYNPKIRDSLAGLAEFAARDRLFLQYLARKKYKEMVKAFQDGSAFKIDDLQALPDALKSRVLYMALRKYLPSGKIYRYHLERLLDLAENGLTGSRVTLPGGFSGQVSYDRLLLSMVENRPTKLETPLRLTVPGRVTLPEGYSITSRIVDRKAIQWPPKKHQAFIDYCCLPRGDLQIRFRLPGDIFHPQGAPGAKKLKEFFIDQKIPRFRRDETPLVTVGSDIVWVAGVRISEKYRTRESTETVLVLEYKVKLRRSKLNKGG